MRRAAPVALAVALLAGCGGGGGKNVVAHVGDEGSTQRQLDAVVGHFCSETQRVGNSFPDEKSAVFKQLRNRLLALLVYRTPSGGEQEGDGGGTFPATWSSPSSSSLTGGAAPAGPPRDA